MHLLRRTAEEASCNQPLDEQPTEKVSVIQSTSTGSVTYQGGATPSITRRTTASGGNAMSTRSARIQHFVRTPLFTTVSNSAFVSDIQNSSSLMPFISCGTFAK